MGRRGTKPQGKIKICWSSEFAYAIGLLTTDGNLSSNGRHMSLVSNDREQIENFKRCLQLNNSIGRHTSGTSKKKGFRVQFGDVLFYKFLVSIGLKPNKSKTLGMLKIANRYFFDFLRGHFDGDGSFYFGLDPRWRSSSVVQVNFLSASKVHIRWLRHEIAKRLKINGSLKGNRYDSLYILQYAKRESLKLFPKLYRGNGFRLKRKYLKIKRALRIIGKPNLV